ncbi:MAG: response regulator [Desulfobacterales bacterium]
MKNLNISNFHLLVVEDHARYMDRLLKRLDKYGYQNITTASSASEAREILSKSHFDVIISDMRMETDDSGFEIIDLVKNLKLSSIVIILTANDTVADCRKALKGKGAWDYISKNMSDTDAMEELHKSVQNALDYFNQWGNAQDKAWIVENTGYLLDHFRGQYVAVLNNAVIESAPDKEELEKKIIDKKLPLFLTVIQRIDDRLFQQLSAKFIVFVEGPTDVAYIKTALKILNRNDLLETIMIDTIGNKIGDQGGGNTNLKSGFAFLKEKRLIETKVLFLADQDVGDKDMPNKGEDYENLYVRRIRDYSREEKGIEWLFPENIWNEAIAKGFAEKTETIKTDKDGSHPPRKSYKIFDKTAFCNRICQERKNKESDFSGFREIIRILEKIMEK